MASQHATLAWAEPVVLLGWVACSGDVFPGLKSSEFVDTLYGVINGHVCKRRDEHLPPAVANSHAVAAITDVLPVPGGP